ncbi:MAG: hypothetical protein ACRDHL_00775, partial [Candidatus Promineifilaceae bacterium]
MGHAFENAIQAAVKRKLPRITLERRQSLAQEGGDFFPDRGGDGPDQVDPWGFAGPYDVTNGWQQSRSPAAGEAFAGRYIGWTFNTWNSDKAGRI